MTSDRCCESKAHALCCARDEGLVLVPSKDNRHGFKHVFVNGSGFSLKAFGAHFGTFRSPESAALAYARSIGPERSRHEAKLAEDGHKANFSRPSLLSDEEVRSCARNEGLTLVTKASAVYKYVYQERSHYIARVGRKHLGAYITPLMAALAVARLLGPTESALQQRKEHFKRQKTMEESDVTSIAEEEGLTLQKSSNLSGYHLVCKITGEDMWYITKDDMRKKIQAMQPNRFPSAAQAALALARVAQPSSKRARKRTREEDTIPLVNETIAASPVVSPVERLPVSDFTTVENSRVGSTDALTGRCAMETDELTSLLHIRQVAQDICSSL